MATTNKHWLSDLLKNKFVKVPLIVIVWALSIFILLIVGKAILGYHVNVFGLEVNTPEQKKDTLTVIKYANREIIDSQPSNKRRETVFIEHNMPAVKLITPITQKINKDSVNKIQSTVIGNSNHTVIGNNSGINGDVTINPSDQRRLMQGDRIKLIQRIQEALNVYGMPDTSIIQITHEMGNTEATFYGSEIIDFLLQKGYRVNNFFYVTIGNADKGFYISSYDKKILTIGVGSKHDRP